MLENFEVDTNIVKLRTDRFSSMKVIAEYVFKAGYLAFANRLVGIAVNDADVDEEVVIIYQADKIMLPCKGDFEAGQLIGANMTSVGAAISGEDSALAYMDADGSVSEMEDAVEFQAIVLETVDTGEDIEWVLCDLLAAPVFITDVGGS